MTPVTRRPCGQYPSGVDLVMIPSREAALASPGQMPLWRPARPWRRCGAGRHQTISSFGGNGGKEQAVATTDAEQRTYRRLAKMQAELDRAEPDSLDHGFRATILAVVAELTKPERQHWVKQYGNALRAAVRAPDLTLEVPFQMPTALADLLARTCKERKVDPDSAICEAITQWCKEKQL